MIATLHLAGVLPRVINILKCTKTALKTGSLNSALAHWLQSRGQLTQPVTVAQGTCIERHGRVSIRALDNGVMIGGQTHILIEGEVQL